MSTEPENDPSKRITRRNFLTFTSAKGLREQGYTFDDPRAPTAEESNDLLRAAIATIKDERVSRLQASLLALEINAAFCDRPSDPRRGDLLLLASQANEREPQTVLITTVTSSPHDPAPAREPTYWITQHSLVRIGHVYGLRAVDQAEPTRHDMSQIIKSECPRTWEHEACVKLLEMGVDRNNIPAPRTGDHVIQITANGKYRVFEVTTENPFADPNN